MITVTQLLFSQNVMDPLKNAVVVHWSAAGQKWDWFEDKKKYWQFQTRQNIWLASMKSHLSISCPVFTWIICDTGQMCAGFTLVQQAVTIKSATDSNSVTHQGFFQVQRNNFRPVDCHDSAPLPLRLPGRRLLAAPWLGAQGPGWAAAVRGLAASAPCPGSCRTHLRPAEPPRHRHPHRTAWSWPSGPRSSFRYWLFLWPTLWPAAPGQW